MSHFTFKAVIQSIIDRPKVDTKSHNVVTITFKEPALTYEGQVKDYNWEVLQGSDACASVDHTNYHVTIDQKFFSNTNMANAVAEIRRNDMLPKIARLNTPLFYCVKEMSDAEIACIINCWIGIIFHFGGEAPYRREFINCMKPISRQLRVCGIEL